MRISNERPCAAPATCLYSCGTSSITDTGRFRRFLLLAALTTASLAAQVADEGTRQLWDENLQTLRPPKAASAGRPKPVVKSTPKAVTGSTPGDAFVGFTLWHLRPSRGDDNAGTRLLIQEEETGPRQQYTPERVSANSSLPEGARVRVSIEPARAGYLYVVDREQYADGSFSDPYLIFPTTQIRGGSNQVGPGTVIEIPDPEDSKPYFRLRRNQARRLSGGGSGPDQVSETLTVLVAPSPLPGLRIGRSAQKLSQTQFAQWEKQWATATKSLEAKAQEGKPYTEAEKKAGQGGAVLTGDDPLPQTLIQVDAKPGDPLLVTVPIRISR